MVVYLLLNMTSKAEDCLCCDLLAGTGWSPRWPPGCPSPGCRCLPGGRASQEQQSARLPTARSALLSCTFHWRPSPLVAGGQKDQRGGRMNSSHVHKIRLMTRMIRLTCHSVLATHNDKYWRMFSHLAETFFDGAEIWKNIIPHHRVFLPFHPDNRAHRTSCQGPPDATLTCSMMMLWEQRMCFFMTSGWVLHIWRRQSSSILTEL